jgi:hypothetical protein
MSFWPKKPDLSRRLGTTTRRASRREWAEYWGAIQEVSDRNGGTYRLPGRPWRFSREELEPLGEPAFQGEHNRDVFGELGLGDDEIDGYVASGALVSVSIPAAATNQSAEAFDLPDMAHESFVAATRR